MWPLIPLKKDLKNWTFTLLNILLISSYIYIGKLIFHDFPFYSTLKESIVLYVNSNC
jgi:hypothetical protein